MKRKFEAVAHIPRGSGDAEYRIMAGDIVVAIIDPDMTLDDPAAVADKIAAAMNVDPDAIL